MALWKPAHETLLSNLWAEGKSGSEIARKLNEDVGPIMRSTDDGGEKPQPINRDMVIAKARRMGLQRRESPIGQRLYG